MGTTSRNVRGILLSYSPSFLIKTPTGVSSYKQVQGIDLSSLPEDLFIKPTLVWKCTSEEKVTT